MERIKLPEHIGARCAAVYVRQSDPLQVIYNTGSRDWQRTLIQLALNLGWQENRILVFEDLGASASASGGRSEFSSLIQCIKERKIGMVFIMEGTRASRNEQDWSILKDACTLTDTWMHIDDRIIDPKNYANRLRLGITQAVSVSLGLQLFEKLRIGKLNKVHKGEMPIALPTGYEHIRVRENERTVFRTVMTEDIKIRDALNLVFTLFNEKGSAISVAAYFVENKLLLPRRTGGENGGIRWITPNGSTILAILRNPTYAGAYVYFRHRNEYDYRPGGDSKFKKIRKSDPDDWYILKDSHPGYITWKQFESNRERLLQNQFGDGIGWAREGAAILAGLAYCGVCGQRLRVAYQASGTPTYRCDWAKRMYKGRLCQCITGSAIEKAVFEQAALALAPSQIHIVAEAKRQAVSKSSSVMASQNARLVMLEHEVVEAKSAWMTALKIASSRSVDEELLFEIENEFLIKKARLEDYRVYINNKNLKQREFEYSNDKLETIINLSTDFHRIWNSDEIDNDLRKELLRSIIYRVEIKKEEDAHRVIIVITWHSGQTTSVVVDDTQYRFRKGTNNKITDIIRNLSSTCTNNEIAKHLNENGYRTFEGHEFTTESAGDIARRNGIVSVRGSRGTHGYTASLPADVYNQIDAAEILGISNKTLRKWGKLKLFDLIPSESRGVWLVYLPEEKIQQLKAFFHARAKHAPTLQDVESFTQTRMSEQQWSSILQLFHKIIAEMSQSLHPGLSSKTFFNCEQHRFVLDGMLWVFRNNAKWSHLPKGCVKPKRALNLLQSWQDLEILDIILSIVSEVLVAADISVLQEKLRTAPRVYVAFQPSPGERHTGLEALGSP